MACSTSGRAAAWYKPSPPPATPILSASPPPISPVPGASLALWQLIDSAFPVGGFAHSGGLEAAVQLGAVVDAQHLEAFVAASLDQSAALLGPFVVATVREPDRFAEFDELFHASLRNDFASSASRTQGQAMLRIAGDVWPTARLEAANRALRGGFRAHWPIGLGLACDAIGAGERDAVDALLYCGARSILSAAVRLNLIGPRQAQQLQARSARNHARRAAAALSTSIHDAHATAPVLDLLQAQHGRLYSRLFVS